MQVHNVNAAALSGLDSLSRRLRWLCIEGLESQLTTSSVPGLGQLTHLTRLQLLNNKGFQPILLSGMMHLEVRGAVASGVYFVTVFRLWGRGTPLGHDEQGWGWAR